MLFYWLKVWEKNSRVDLTHFPSTTPYHVILLQRKYWLMFLAQKRVVLFFNFGL